MVNIEDFAQPPDPEKSAEIDRRIVEDALKRAGLDTRLGQIGQDPKFPEPVQDYSAPARKKREADARLSGIAEGITLAVEILDRLGVDEGLRQLKTTVEKLKKSP